MKIGEYHILRMTFDKSFGFMLNRIADAYEDYGMDFSNKKVDRERVSDLCFNEFMAAFEELGAKFEEDN